MEEYCKENIAKIKALEKVNKEQVQTIKEILKYQKETNKKLDAVIPTIDEINDMRNAWSWTGKFMGVIIKIVLGVGILMGGIYALKEWIKKP